MAESYFDWNAMADPVPGERGRFTIKVPILDQDFDHAWAKALVNEANPYGIHTKPWGRVSVYPPNVEVEDVAPGSQAALRQFLEDAGARAQSLVEQGSDMGSRLRSDDP